MGLAVTLTEGDGLQSSRLEIWRAKEVQATVSMLSIIHTALFLGLFYGTGYK